MDGRRARKVLGVGSDAGPQAIRRAFHIRAHATHPDHGGDARDFAEVLAAMDALRGAPEPQPKRHALSRAPARVDVYDSPLRRAPRRDFADVLRGAVARQR